MSQEILEQIMKMHVIDTHEHTYPHKLITGENPTIIDILKGSYIYFFPKFPPISPPSDKNNYESIVKRLREIMGSAFYKSCSLAIKEIYGVDIDPPTINALAEASRLIQEAYRDREWTRKIFREMALIDVVLLDPYWDIWGGSFDPDLFKPVFRINMFAYGYSREAVDHNGNTPYSLEKPLNLRVQTFDDYLNLIDKALRKAKERGYIAIKSALAYERPILFKEVEENEARKVFEKKGGKLTPKEVEIFGDFILHYILDKARELEFPIQFHTGLARIEGSNPLNVVNLIRKYSDLKFILFHGGYPWIRETAAITLTFENTYLDLCWLPTIAPSAFKLILREVIELGLSSKVMWGGDCWTAEGTYGALKFFKTILAEVLEELIERNYLRKEEALEIASRIMKENAVKLFNL